MNYKRVLYLFEGSYPHGMAMAKRLHLYAKGMQELGAKQHILVAHPRLQDPEGEGSHENIPFTNLPLPFRNSKNAAVRSAAVWLIRKNLILQTARVARHYDVLFYIGHSWFMICLASLLAKAYGKKLVIEVNEYPYVTVGDRRFNNKQVARFNQWVTLKLAYRLVSGVVVISDNLRALLMKQSLHKDSILKIPILVPQPLQIPVLLNGKTRFNEPYIFHAGTLNEQKDGIIAVFNAFAEAAKHNLKLRFVLTHRITIPSTLAKIDQIIQQNHLQDRVVFLNHISNEEVLQHMKQCALAIINRPANRQNQHNFSTKLGEYLINGVPLLSTAVGESANYLKHSENSYVFEPDNVQKIAQLIIQVLSDPEQALSVAQKGKDMAESEFSYKKHAARLLNFINSL